MEYTGLCWWLPGPGLVGVGPPASVLYKRAKWRKFINFVQYESGYNKRNSALF